MKPLILGDAGEAIRAILATRVVAGTDSGDVLRLKQDQDASSGRNLAGGL
jgi:hypothetical protein